MSSSFNIPFLAYEFRSYRRISNTLRCSLCSSKVIEFFLKLYKKKIKTRNTHTLIFPWFPRFGCFLFFLLQEQQMLFFALPFCSRGRANICAFQQPHIPSVVASHSGKELSYPGLVSPTWTPYSSSIPVTSIEATLSERGLQKLSFSSPIARTINRGSFEIVSRGWNIRLIPDELELDTLRLTSQSINYSFIDNPLEDVRL